VTLESIRSIHDALQKIQKNCDPWINSLNPWCSTENTEKLWPLNQSLNPWGSTENTEKLSALECNENQFHKG
jgi:hypothetical protein